MRTVRQLLSQKSHQRIIVIAPDRSTYEALQLMAQFDIGAVAVVKDGRLLGLMTEREYARKIVLQGKASRNTPVGELMLSPVACVGPDQTLDHCMALMSEKHVRYLPVLEEGHLVGMVSIGDVVKNVMIEQKISIENLERYITGGEFGMPSGS